MQTDVCRVRTDMNGVIADSELASAEEARAAAGFCVSTESSFRTLSRTSSSSMNDVIAVCNFRSRIMGNAVQRGMGGLPPKGRSRRVCVRRLPVFKAL